MAESTTTLPVVEMQNSRSCAQTGEPKNRPSTRSCQTISPLLPRTQVTMPESLQRNSNPPLAKLVGTYGIDRRSLYAKLGDDPLATLPGLRATR